MTSSHLADGTYPSWAGGGRAAWLAAAALAAAPDGAGRAALAQAFARADRLIGALNASRDDGQVDFDEHDAYNTTAVAALIDTSGHSTRAVVGCVGDAAALLDPVEGEARLLTRFQTDGAERLRDVALVETLDERARTVLFRRELRNRLEPWHGIDGVGFGVLDGTGRFARLVEWLDVDVQRGDRLYLCSDTAGRCLASIAASGGRLPPTPDEVVAATRGWEAATAARYPDDVTIVIVEIA